MGIPDLKDLDQQYCRFGGKNRGQLLRGSSNSPKISSQRAGHSIDSLGVTKSLGTLRVSSKDHKCRAPSITDFQAALQVFIPNLRSELLSLELYTGFEVKGKSSFALRRNFLGSFESDELLSGPSKEPKRSYPCSRMASC